MISNIGGSPNQWFAVRTKSNREAVVTEALIGKGFDAWCPRFREHSRQTQTAGKPVFPSYVFCHLDVSRRLPVLTVPGVLNIVSSGKTPLPIEQREMDSLRVVMESVLPVAPHAYLQTGDFVRIKEGPLAGAEGYVVEKECEHLVVSITLLQRSVSVAVDGYWLEKTCRVAA